MAAETIPVYLEVGKKKVFAGALEWPGWARSGRDPEAARQALLDYAPRYARALQASPAGAQLAFQLPAELAALEVVEQLAGGSGTDFGAPGAIPTADEAPLDEAQTGRLLAVLEASWLALAAAAQAAEGRALRKGPRGGGRDLPGILHHVLEADAAYLRKLGWPFRIQDEQTAAAELERLHTAMRQALPAGTAW